MGNAMPAPSRMARRILHSFCATRRIQGLKYSANLNEHGKRTEKRKAQERPEDFSRRSCAFLFSVRFPCSFKFAEYFSPWMRRVAQKLCKMRLAIRLGAGIALPMNGKGIRVNPRRLRHVEDGRRQGGQGSARWR